MLFLYLLLLVNTLTTTINIAFKGLINIIPITYFIIDRIFLENVLFNYDLLFRTLLYFLHRSFF